MTRSEFVYLALIGYPRSRRVYASRAMLCPSVSGSSPLARGLPCRHAAPLSGSRIIPARAGFTAR